MFGRKVDNRLDNVIADHDVLYNKYSYLTHCNDYYAKLAEQIITITELNCTLLRSDESDKTSISLMGVKGPQTIAEKQNEVQIHRIQ